MNLSERLAGIDANLDDVQAGAEACSRAAETLVADTAKCDGLLKGPLSAVARHVKDLQGCARDLQPALQELRNSVARLREELKAPSVWPFDRRRSRYPTDSDDEPSPSEPLRALRRHAITAEVDGRFVTTSCGACHAVVIIEFDPPDAPHFHARIERIDERH